ncbi:MAG: OsmC family protein [Calditrichaeota bacterium]|nr:OsmC family protein [Calditrichota bacterium]
MTENTEQIEQPIPTPHVCDGGNLDCGSGLLLIIRKAMDQVPDGDVLEIRSTELSVCNDLPAWCRMTENPYLGWKEGSETNSFFVQRGGKQEDVDAELAKARAYKFQTRIRWKGDMTSTVYARNHSFAVGQPASFDVQDIAPSALEYLLGSLGGCLVMGLQIHASREGVKIDQIELSLNAKPNNLLVFLGLEEDGHPGFEEISGTAFVESDAPLAKIRELWEYTLRVSPVTNTLFRGAKLNLQVHSLD